MNGRISRLATSGNACGGFSLVEIVLALGLVSFCLVAILGLLPTGLLTVREANRQAEASRLLKQMATGLQEAQTTSPGHYRMLGLGSFSNVTWTAGSARLAPVTGVMNASGFPGPVSAESEYAYRLEITPPVDAWSCGSAVLHVAWPAASTWEGGQWKTSQGAVRCLVLFRAE